ncbi:MAG: RpiB/LacA/LacB family sugar-phosphate isomerase [Actinomycetia bacterium]|nr:RpiB/LacA/LacB family sugar-phosphate isomerase [Actinomycetes bacterium]
MPSSTSNSPSPSETRALSTAQPKKRIAIAADHRGFELKRSLAAWLGEQGFAVTDLGPFNDDPVDYPDYAAKVAEAVSLGQDDFGVLICGTGIGMAMAANKFAGVRAANLTSPEFAALARQHNAANVAALSGAFVDEGTNRQILSAFLGSEPLNDRHARRVAKIDALGQLRINPEPSHCGLGPQSLS